MSRYFKDTVVPVRKNREYFRVRTDIGVVDGHRPRVLLELCKTTCLLYFPIPLLLLGGFRFSDTDPMSFQNRTGCYIQRCKHLCVLTEKTSFYRDEYPLSTLKEGYTSISVFVTTVSTVGEESDNGYGSTTTSL